MKNEAEINKEIAESLQSISNIKRAEGAPYLLTRINAKINLQSKSIWENIALLICRPAIMGIGLFLILLINISVIIMQRSQKSTVISERGTSALAAEEEEDTAAYTTYFNTDNP